jgi:hypothetical protein
VAKRIAATLSDLMLVIDFSYRSQSTLAHLKNEVGLMLIDPTNFCFSRFEESVMSV